MLGKIKKFLNEVNAELKKVSWSTREELIGSTFIIIITTFILAFFIGVVDIALSAFLSFVFR